MLAVLVLYSKTPLLYESNSIIINLANKNPIFEPFRHHIYTQFQTSSIKIFCQHINSQQLSNMRIISKHLYFAFNNFYQMFGCFFTIIENELSLFLLKNECLQFFSILASDCIFLFLIPA